MKKLISILTVLTMLFTIAAIPAMAEGDVAPDFVTDNIAYGKPFYAAKFTSWNGVDNTGSGKKVNSCPVGATPSWATDGNIKTYHYGIGKVVNSASSQNGVITYVDLGAEYMISEVIAWQPEGKNQALKIYTSLDIKAEPNKTSSAPRNEKHPKNLVGTTVAGGSLTIDGKVYNERKLVFADATKADVPARYVFFEYADRYDTYIAEIIVKGTPVTGTAVDFRAEDNLAYNVATVTGFSGTFWGMGAPSSSNRKATDAQISTAQTGTGQWTNGLGFKVDLGAYYNVSEVSLYSTYSASPTYLIYQGNLTKTGDASDADHQVNYIDETGVKADYIVKIPAETEKKSVNNVDSFVSTHTFENSTEPVRYLYITLSNYSTQLNEMVIKGTPVSALETGNAIYNYDSSTGKVKANIIVANGSESAKDGDLFFAAYSGDTLVGATFANADLVAKTGSYDAVVEFPVTAEPTTVKAYFWTDKLVPIFDSAIDLK